MSQHFEKIFQSVISAIGFILCIVRHVFASLMHKSKSNTNTDKKERSEE